MELQIFAPKPISNPVIPSFTTIVSYSITPPYYIVLSGNTPINRMDTNTEKPILTLPGVFDMLKNGAEKTKEVILTRTSKKYSNVSSEKL